MTENGIYQISFLLIILLLLVKPLGAYMALVYENKSFFLNRFFGPVERGIYRLCSIQPEKEMGWRKYLFTMLALNFVGILVLYFLQRLQFLFPLNPQHFSAIPAELAFNTAASFGTNTDWQAYAGEATMSHFTQMVGFTVQNFLSAATGMALLIAFIRGITRHETTKLGNFWVDTVRGTLYILLPLALILAVLLSSQGVIQNFKSSEKVHLLQPISYQTQNETKTLTEQIIPMGPVASQVAIKQLGSNGGGFFNVNSAHPFENPTPLTNFLEMLAILLIPAALCYTFGVMVKDTRQGWAILITMLCLFAPLAFFAVYEEQQGNPLIAAMGIDTHSQGDLAPGGNMEGKETRFGIVSSALWATATTATSNGSVNAMHDSFTPLGGFVPLWMMHIGEIAFGGVGSGLYSMLLFIIITVFISGLMVGRTPEYLGKKIEPYEMKMAVFAVLLMPMLVLLFAALGSLSPNAIQSTLNPGAHGFGEILYAFTSMGNNNGSAFAGLNANTHFYNVLGAIEMLFIRYWMAIPTLAIAGALVKKKIIPTSAGTLSTHTFLFVLLLICVSTLLAALSFFPALSLGPIVEHLMLWGNQGG